MLQRQVDALPGLILVESRTHFACPPPFHNKEMMFFDNVVAGLFSALYPDRPDTDGIFGGIEKRYRIGLPHVPQTNSAFGFASLSGSFTSKP